MRKKHIQQTINSFHVRLDLVEGYTKLIPSGAIPCYFRKLGLDIVPASLINIVRPMSKKIGKNLFDVNHLCKLFGIRIRKFI